MISISLDDLPTIRESLWVRSPVLLYLRLLSGRKMLTSSTAFPVPKATATPQTEQLKWFSRGSKLGTMTLVKKRSVNSARVNC